MTEFIPDLWLYKTKHTRRMNLRNVFHVNTEKDLDYLTNEPSRLTHELSKLYRYIEYKISEIYKHLENNIMVIVSCKSAKYIGPLIIACFLIKYAKMPIGDVLNTMKSKQVDVFDGQIMYSQVLERFGD